MYVNTLSATEGTASVIDRLELINPYNGETMSAKVNHVLSFKRAPCISPDPSLGINKEMIISIAESMGPGITISEENVVLNAFDESSVAASVFYEDAYHQISLSRYRLYDTSDLSDETIIHQLNNFGFEHTRTNLNVKDFYVYNLTPNEAKITVDVVDATGFTIQYVANFRREMDWFLEDNVLHPIVAPTEESYTPGNCQYDTRELMLSTGALTDGYEYYWGGMECRWVIRAPDGVQIKIMFDRFEMGDCNEGSIEIEGNAYCEDNAPATLTSTSNEVEILFRTDSETYSFDTTNGFFFRYEFTTHDSTPHTNIVPFEYSDWNLDPMEAHSEPGSPVCVLGDPDASFPWQWSGGSATMTVDESCHAYSTIAASNEWECYGTGGDGSQSCLNEIDDLSAPWSAVSREIQHHSNLNWLNTSSTLIQNAAQVYTEADNSLTTQSFVADAGSVQVNFKSLQGGSGRVRIRYSTPRIYYVAPVSYTPPDGSYGDGSRKRPFVYTLSYLLANVTEEGDMLRLYPGRYEGTGYCALSFKHRIVIESTSGPKWTLLDCLSAERGWTLEHTIGTSQISGLSFIGCSPTSSPFFGAALLLKGKSEVKDCRFFGNTHASTGTVSVVSPGSATIEDCLFEGNTGSFGSGLAVLSTQATVINSEFNSNTALQSGAFHVAKYSSGGVTLNTPASVIMKDSTFVSNSANVAGGSISATTGCSLHLENVNVEHTLAGEAMNLDGAEATIINSNILRNMAGGIVAVRSTFLDIRNTEFKMNSNMRSPGNGAAIRLDDSHVDIIGSKFEMNVAEGLGGAISSVRSATNISDCDFEFNTAGSKGGAVSLTDLSPALATRHNGHAHIKNSRYKGNKAEYGGAVSITSSVAMVGENLYEDNIAEESGGAMLVELITITANDEVLYVNTFNSEYKNNSATNGGSVSVLNSIDVGLNNETIADSKATTYGGSLYFLSSYALLQNSLIERSSALGSGGSIYAASSSSIVIRDTSVHTSMSTDEGGVLVLSASTGKVYNSEFHDSNSQLGGSIAILSQSLLFVTDLTIEAASAEKGGALYAVDTSVSGYSINGLYISRAIASDSGGAFYFVLAELELLNVQVSDSNAEFGGVMTLQSSNVTISSSVFQSCVATANGGALYAITSTIYLANNTIIDKNRAVSGAGLYAFASTVYSHKTTFSENKASSSGGATTLITSSLYASKVSVVQNRAGKGGGIHSDLSVVDLLSSNFNGNNASEAGGALYLLGDSQINSRDCIFELNKAELGGAGRFFQVNSFNFENAVFRRNTATMTLNTSSVIEGDDDDEGEFEDVKGGALEIDNVALDSYFTNTTFVRNTALGDGGALRINLGKLNPTLLISKSSFESNRGDFGGAINSLSSTITLDECTFTGQVAKSGGGGIFWTGVEPTGLQDGSSSYSDNKASYGPNYASIAHRIIPMYNGSAEASGEPFENEFKVLVVDKYGSTITTDNSVQVQVSRVTEGSFLEGPTKSVAENGIASFPGFGVRFNPGLSANFSVSSGDLLIDNEIKVDIRQCLVGEVQPEGLQRCNRCPYGEYSKLDNETACHKCPEGAVCYGGSHMTNKRGYWRFEDTEGVCTGATKYDGCSLNKCLLEEACVGTNESTEVFSIARETDGYLKLTTSTDLTASGYEANQTIMVMGIEKQIKSVTGTYLLLEPDTNIQEANDVVIHFEDNEACDPRFAGHLCNKCAKGYSRSGKTDCAPCPKTLVWTYLVMFGGIFAAAAVAVVLIRMTIAKSRKKKSRMSVMTKIFTSYLQLVSLASSFELNWPAEVLMMFSAQETVSSPGEHLISVECVFDALAEGDAADLSELGVAGEVLENTLALPMYYKKLAFFLAMPIVAAIIPCIFWFWRYLVHRARHIRGWSWKRFKIEDKHNGNVVVSQLESLITAAGDTPTDILVDETRRIANLDEDHPQPLKKVRNAFIAAKKGEMWDKAILSIIVLVFLLHPNVTKQIFLMFTCMSLKLDDGGHPVQYLTSALDVNCEHPFHQKIMMFVGIPSLLLYTIGIPAFGFYILYQRRTRLLDPRIKLQFGFLYDGYEQKYYYWELWVMMRKVLIIFVSVFLSKIGTATQSLGATSITFFALYVHLRAMPYEEDVLDDLEQFSLLTSLFTLYCGLFFFQDEIDEYGKYGLVGMIFLGNFCFLYFFIKLILIELKQKASDALEKTKSKLFKKKNKKVKVNSENSSREQATVSGGKVTSASVVTPLAVNETDDVQSTVISVAPTEPKEMEVTSFRED